MSSKPTTVDEYIDLLSEPAMSMMIQLRSILKEVAPDAQETIKWSRPIFESKVILFAYAAYKRHISFFPTGPALEPFVKDIADAGLIKKQDSIQLPYDKELPVDLIKRIAQYRLEDVEERDAKWRY